MRPTVRGRGRRAEVVADANRRLVNPTARKCVTADSTANGGNLVLRTCGGTLNQKWHKP